MARMLSLAVERREGAKNEDIRSAGKMPAVFYGPKEESTPVAVVAKEFKKVWKQAGESSVIILKEGKNEHEALIYDVDVHPLSGEPRHADFYVIEKGKKVKVRVPLVFSGISPAVKDKGAILIKVLRDMEIEAAPRDLPRELSVDISKLVEYNDAVHAKDVVLPAGVELKSKPDEVLASVAEAKEEVVEAAPVDMSAIEVTDGKGKEVKEGEAGAAAAPGGKPAADAKGGAAKPAAEGKKPETKK
jgi:large subunit ribosomal protein L25